MKSHDYEHMGTIVSGIEWSMPPQPPQRICQCCPTRLSRYNPGTMCAVCERKAVRQSPQPKTDTRLDDRLARWRNNGGLA